MELKFQVKNVMMETRITVMVVHLIVKSNLCLSVQMIAHQNVMQQVWPDVEMELFKETRNVMMEIKKEMMAASIV